MRQMLLIAGLAVVCQNALANVGIDSKKRVWQWQDKELPQLISELPKAQALASRDERYFVLDENGQLWAWGSNNYGQLGLGHFSAVTSPQKVSMPDQVRLQSVAAGPYHTLAVDTNGKIWVWGGNPRGQLGNAPASVLSMQTRPVLLETSFKSSRVSANLTQSFAQDSEGKLWQWGGADAGQVSPPKLAKNMPSLPPPAQIRLISGQISSSAGKPIAGADILVNGQSCAKSQADGRFICAVPARLSGEIDAKANGFKFNQRLKLPLSSDLDKANWVAEAPPELTRTVALPASTPKTQTVNTTQAPPAVRTEPPPRKTSVTLSGWVRTGSSAGSGLGGVAVQGKGASCSTTDDSGRFSCQVPAGWNGTLSVSKTGYRFAPSSVSLSGNQDDDPEVQTFRAYFEPR